MILKWCYNDIHLKKQTAFMAWEELIVLQAMNIALVCREADCINLDLFVWSAANDLRIVSSHRSTDTP